MGRTLLWFFMIGLLAASFAGCGGAGSSITGPTLLMETPGTEQ